MRAWVTAMRSMLPTLLKQATSGRWWPFPSRHPFCLGLSWSWQCWRYSCSVSTAVLVYLNLDEREPI